MAQPVTDPAQLARIPANRDVLVRVTEGAMPARAADAWNPGGWVMRTHPDLTEALETVAPDDVRIVAGMTLLVTPGDFVYGVGAGMSIVWLRVPSGPALDDALGGGEASAVEELPGWIGVDAWRVDLGTWVRASAALTREILQGREGGHGA
jgi:hypothetical protein